MPNVPAASAAAAAAMNEEALSPLTGPNHETTALTQAYYLSTNPRVPQQHPQQEDESQHDNDGWVDLTVPKPQSFWPFYSASSYDSAGNGMPLAVNNAACTRILLQRIFLLGACLSALFQDASDVTVLSVLQPFFLLGFGMTTTTTRCHYDYYNLVGGYSLICVLRAVPAVDYFYYETTRLVAYCTSLVVILMIYFLVGMAVVAQVSVWRRQVLPNTTTTTNTFYSQQQQQQPQQQQHERIRWHSLVFPILQTSLFQLLFRFSPIGGTANPAMGLSRVAGLRQLACLTGEISLVFWMAWAGSLGLEGVLLSTKHTRQYQRQLCVWVALTFFLLVFGWMREGRGWGFYLQSMEAWPMAQTPVLVVSCLTRPLDNNRQVMMDRTHRRMMAGDDLILWSESALLEPMAWHDLDWSVATNPGTVVATTFFQNVTNKTDSNSKVYNSVALWTAQGLVTEYNKNRPVPVLEDNVQGGTVQPTIHTINFTPISNTDMATTTTTSTGSIKNKTVVQRQVSAAICFDLDFDYLSRNAHQADLMIGPSWYWASIGAPMWHHNRFRAIENGFHLVKCSEKGISGHVDNYGRVGTAIPTLENQVHVMEIPLSKGVTTVYSSYYGFLFGWICVGLAPCVLFNVVGWKCPLRQHAVRFE